MKRPATTLKIEKPPRTAGTGDWMPGGSVVNEQEITRMVDEALERFARRDLVSGSEVVDFLLDLRNTALAPDALEEFLESEAQTAGAT